MAGGQSTAWSQPSGRSRLKQRRIGAAQVRRLAAEVGPAAIATRLGIARSSVYRLLG